MIIYLLYVASPVLVAMILNMMTTVPFNESDRWRKIYLAICGIVMALMIGLRNPRVGSDDTQFYVNTYEYFQYLSLPQLIQLHIDMEIGYLLCTWLLSHIFHDGQWLLVLSGIFFAVTVCNFSYKNCKNLTLALLVFNCLGLFNFMVQGLRQAIAMCICLWALAQIQERRNLRFFLLVALASIFHASAIVFFAIYPISKLRLTTKGIFFFFVFSIGAIGVLPMLFELLNQAINDSYEIGTSANSGGVVAILIYLVTLIFGLMYVDTSDPAYPMFVYMTILSAICMVMRNIVSGIVERVSFYFSFGQMVIIANSSQSSQNANIDFLIRYLAGVLLLGVALYKTTYSVLIPYTFFWQ